MSYWGFCPFWGLCPLPGVPGSSIRYLAPGMGIQLVETGPKWPRIVRLTLSKGPGPFVSIQSFLTGLRPMDPIPVPRPGGHWAQMGQNGRKGLKTGQTRPQIALNGPFDLPYGSGPRPKKSFLPVSGPRFGPRNGPQPYPCADLEPRPSGATTAQEGSK